MSFLISSPLRHRFWNYNCVIFNFDTVFGNLEKLGTFLLKPTVNKVFYASVIAKCPGKKNRYLFQGFFFITRMWLVNPASYFCITLILVIYFSNRMTNYQFDSKIHNWHVFCSASYLPAMGLNDKWYVHSHCLGLDLNGLLTKRNFWCIPGMLENYTIPN